MRTSLLIALAASAVLAAQAPAPTPGRVADPIPLPLAKRGLRVEIRDVTRLPDTRALRPSDQDVTTPGWARTSYVRELADGRRFANDSRGVLYLLEGGTKPSAYLNVAEAFPLGFYRSLQSGFIGFEFHPEFAKNGLLYTVHGERVMGNPTAPHFVPPGYTPADVTSHTVITEWRAANPMAAVFNGSRRELLRTGHVVNSFFHPIGHLEFNPTSKPGAPDYGLLYVSGTDFGFSNGGGPRANNPGQTQRLDSIVGAMLRIDPRSPSESKGQKGIGDYTVPVVNRFASDGDPKTLGEIYAYGFRNIHRFSWDTDGTLYASDIGMSQVEEVNIIREGGNYGWWRREGTFDNGVHVPGGNMDDVVARPADILSGRQRDGFTYPVVMYDHGEGQAITAGFGYHGRIAALRGKFVFGDIQRGRLFAADLAAMKRADDGIPQTTAPVEEIQLFVRDANGTATDVTLHQLIEKTMGKPAARADLHLSRTRAGEILITNRQDGVIRLLVP
jgi:hypothetical protein